MLFIGLNSFKTFSRLPSPSTRLAHQNGDKRYSSVHATEDSFSIVVFIKKPKKIAQPTTHEIIETDVSRNYNLLILTNYALL